jgi:hypothetical protein
MPDYPLTPRLYGRAHGNLRVAGETCSVRTAGQTPDTAHGAKTRDRVMTVGYAGARLSTGARLAHKISNRYIFNSCLRTNSLGCGPKAHLKSTAAAPTRETLL